MDSLTKQFRKEICDRLIDRTLPPEFALNQVDLWQKVWALLPITAKEALGYLGISFSAYFAESAYRGYPQPLLVIYQVGNATLAHAAHLSDLDALCKITRTITGVDMVQVIGADLSIVCRFNNCTYQWTQESLPLPSDWMEAG